MGTNVGNSFVRTWKATIEHIRKRLALPAMTADRSHLVVVAQTQMTVEELLKYRTGSVTQVKLAATTHQQTSVAHLQAEEPKASFWRGLILALLQQGKQLIVATVEAGDVLITHHAMFSVDGQTMLMMVSWTQLRYSGAGR